MRDFTSKSVNITRMEFKDQSDINISRRCNGVNITRMEFKEKRRSKRISQRIV